MLREKKYIILLELQALHDITTPIEVYLMAKKTAPKKKSTVAKAKSKPAKPVKAAKKPSKPIKLAKSAAKVMKAIVKVLKPTPVKVVKEKPVKQIKPAKPALMTKKGKKAVDEEEVEVPEVKKTQTIVSMMEAEPVTDEAAKVEKISKVKPVKVDRGNLNDEKAKWAELYKKYGKDKAVTYKMTERFPTLAPLQHKVLGWGFILTNENDRLEVLFENGIRMLISNYKN